MEKLAKARQLLDEAALLLEDENYHDEAIEVLAIIENIK